MPMACSITEECSMAVLLEWKSVSWSGWNLNLCDVDFLLFLSSICLNIVRIYILTETCTEKPLTSEIRSLPKSMVSSTFTSQDSGQGIMSYTCAEICSMYLWLQCMQCKKKYYSFFFQHVLYPAQGEGESRVCPVSTGCYGEIHSG